MSRTLMACLCLLIVSTQVAASNRDCKVSKYDDRDYIQIPIIFQFKNPRFRTDSIYNSLSPTLTAPSTTAPRPPMAGKVIDGRLEVSFCVEGRTFEGTESRKFVVNLASHSFTVVTRPISWIETTITGPRGRKLRQGTMASILFLEQPDPDWAILQTARVLAGLQPGEWLLEAVIENRSTEPVAMDAVLLEALGGSSSCFNGPSSATQTLFLSWNRLTSTGFKEGAWTVIGDTNIRVKAQYNVGACTEAFFKADIPLQVTVAPKELARVVLRLQELPGDTPKSDTPKSAMSHLLQESPGDTPKSAMSHLFILRSSSPLNWPMALEVRSTSSNKIFPKRLDVTRQE